MKFSIEKWYLLWIYIFFLMAETYDSKEIKNISHTLQFRTILYTSSPCTDSALRNKMMTDCVKRGKAPGRLVTALLKVWCQIPTQITNPRCMTDNSVANFFSNVRNIFVFWKSMKTWLTSSHYPLHDDSTQHFRVVFLIPS